VVFGKKIKAEKINQLECGGKGHDFKPWEKWVAIKHRLGWPVSNQKY
jgi:hypothetical protein